MGANPTLVEDQIGFRLVKTMPSWVFWFLKLGTKFFFFFLKKQGPLVVKNCAAHLVDFESFEGPKVGGMKPSWALRHYSSFEAKPKELTEFSF